MFPKFAWPSRKPLPNPLHQFSEIAREETRLTPDIAQLERSEFQRVFIYGEMMRNHRAALLLSPEVSEYDSTCFTEERYVLWKKRAGQASSAIAMENTGTWFKPSWADPHRLRIQGELYIVSSPHLIQLDKFYQNTLEFERKRVTLLRPYYHLVRIKAKDSYKARGIVSHQRGCTMLQAHMYVGKEEFWANQLGRMFTPVTMYTSANNPWLGDYYAFSKKEYEI